MRTFLYFIKNRPDLQDKPQYVAWAQVPNDEVSSHRGQEKRGDLHKSPKRGPTRQERERNTNGKGSEAAGGAGLARSTEQSKRSGKKWGEPQGPRDRKEKPAGPEQGGQPASELPHGP